MSTATTIHQALVAVQAEIKAAQKSGENKFDRYNYAKLEDYLDQAKPLLAKHGLALVVSCDEVIALEPRTTKAGGNETAARVRITARLLHESGNTLEVTCYGEGQDRADKAIYKAITGAKKYAVAGLLAIPTTDDPEADESVGLTTPRGTTAKVATVTGEVKPKVPTWTPEQMTEAGTLRAELIELGGDLADAEVKAIKSRMKYDAPTDVIDELTRAAVKWRDIAAAGKAEAKS